VVLSTHPKPCDAHQMVHSGGLIVVYSICALCGASRRSFDQWELVLVLSRPVDSPKRQQRRGPVLLPDEEDQFAP